MISMMFSAPSRTGYFSTFTSGLISWIGDLRRVDLGHADAVVRVRDLALQVGQVDDVVVDDPQRSHAGRGEIEGGGRAESAGAEQQHLGVEQLHLPLEPDLGDEHVARVALALLGGQRARDLDLVAAVLPERDRRPASRQRPRSRAAPAACGRPAPSGCPRRSRGSRAWSDRSTAPSMRDSRCPRGTWTAPGRCACSNSCCSRTSTMTAPLPFWLSPWTSLGSTSSICSLILRMTSAPLAIRPIPPKSGRNSILHKR